MISHCTDLFPYKEPLLSICHLGDMALSSPHARSEVMGPSNSFHALATSLGPVSSSFKATTKVPQSPEVEGRAGQAHGPQDFWIITWNLPGMEGPGQKACDRLAVHLALQQQPGWPWQCVGHRALPHPTGPHPRPWGAQGQVAKRVGGRRAGLSSGHVLLIQPRSPQ